MQAADQPAKRPNIILFMVDDMGWEDTSLPFWTEKTHYNEVYETPNMERLARQGVMFTQAYASSISSPSRCSLITGTNAARHRVTNWTLQKDKTTDRKDSLLDIPDWNYNGVSQVTGTNNTFVGTSFVQLLKNSGYHTIHCGKAHFGAIDTPGEDPHHWGFEVNIAGHAAGGLASYLGEENYGHTKDGKPTSLMSIPGLEKYWGTETFATEALTLEAIKALDKAKKYNQPFYLYMSHYAIHIPLNKDMRFYEKYKKKGMTDHEAAYATLIEGMDKSLGDIREYLKKNNLDKNTVIIFMADNGGLAISGRMGNKESNYPLSFGKGSNREGGIREPMIVYWPGVTKAESVCTTPVIIEDFFPTILEIAGAKKIQAPQVVDGKSFVALLKGGSMNPNRPLLFHTPNVWGEGNGNNSLYSPSTAMRQGDWKLIYWHPDQKFELFNLKEDISEEHNLAEQQPERVKAMARTMTALLKERKAQMPTYKKNNPAGAREGAPVPWPDQAAARL